MHGSVTRIEISKIVLVNETEKTLGPWCLTKNENAPSDQDVLNPTKDVTMIHPSRHPNALAHVPGTPVVL